MHRRHSILIVTAVLMFGSQLAHADTLRDPTRPYTTSHVVGSKTAPFVVSAIFASKQRRVAIVNGQAVVEGETIDGAIVVEILQDSLRLRLDGNEILARVVPAGLRK